MNWANILIVYRKELMDMLRDRRTILSMFLFPLILFPIITVGYGTFERKMRQNVEKEQVHIALVGEQHAPRLAARMRESGKFRFEAAGDDFQQRIDRKDLRAALEFPANFERDVAAGAPAQLTIHFFQGEIRSGTAVDRIEEEITAYRKEVLAQRLASASLPVSALTAIETKRENVAAPEKVAGSRLAIFLPYLIIVLCLTGAMHPAMDLTAGEKERGTMETILASPVGRRDLVIGKFLLVLTVSLVTTLMSLSSYLGTMLFAKDYLRDVTQGQSLSFGPQAFATLFFMVMPLAIFFGALLIAMAVAAKNYKEAQQSIGSLMIFAFLPAIIGMIPGIELSPKMALVPILNVSLVAKEVLTGNFPWTNIGIAFAASCFFAGVALNAAISRFQNEEVMFRE